MNLEAVGPFIPIIIMFVIFYFLLIRPRQNGMLINKKLINYCRNCGTALESNYKIIADNVICSACGFATLDGDKFCQSCGETTHSRQSLCIKCSSALVSKKHNIVTSQVNDSSDGGVAFISFLIPLIGFILYATMLSNQPKRANSALTGALLGSVIGAIGAIIIFSIIGF